MSDKKYQWSKPCIILIPIFTTKYDDGGGDDGDIQDQIATS